MASWRDLAAPVPRYFGPVGSPVFGMLEPAPGPVGAGLGVVICTSLVNEGIVAHRALRLLARELAASGLPTLRFDPPSSGDSDGADDDPGLIARWRDSVSWAADELRASTGVETVAFVGLRLGATLAVSAVDGGLLAGGLVLWGPPLSGKRWLREERSYHRLAQQVPPTEHNPRSPDGEEFAGFRLSAATVAELVALDLLDTPETVWPAGLPVLVDPSARSGRELVGALESRGAAVEQRHLPGLTAMLEEAERAEPPRAAIAAIVGWLGALASASGRRAQAPASRPVESPAAVATMRDGVREGAFLVDGESGRLFGLTCEAAPGTPEKPVQAWVVLFNAGFVRHIGPNRMYVRWARRWARRGLPSLRVDGRSVGESDGKEGPHRTVTELYTEGAVADAAAMVVALRERREANEFVLVGLCSGAYMAFHVARRLAGVRAVVLINPQILSWDVEESVIGRARYVRRSLLSWSQWRGLLLRRTAARQIRDRIMVLVRAAAASVHRRLRRGTVDDHDGWLASALGRLQQDGVAVHFVMSVGDVGLSYLERHLGPELDRAPAGSFQLHLVEHADHTFRPLASQERLAAIVDAAVGFDALP